MPHTARMEAFVKTVCEQIRFKRARAGVARELMDHMCDQKQAYCWQGFEEAQAEKKAVEQMGDPVTVGMQMDLTHRPKPQWGLFVLTAALLLVGIGLQGALFGQGDPSGQLTVTLIAASLGVMGMVGAYFADYTVLARAPLVIYWIFLAVAFVHFACLPVVNGAGQRGTLLFLLFPAVFSGVAFHFRQKGYGGLLASYGLMALGVLACMRAFSMRLGVLILIVCLLLLTVMVGKGQFRVKKRWALPLLYLPVAGGCAVFAWGYWGRLMTAFSSEEGLGYLTTVTRQLISGAVLIGPGTTADSLARLPELDTSYVLTFLIVKFGWIPFFLVVGLFATFFGYAVFRCLRQTGLLARMTSTAILSTLLIETLFYLAANLGFLELSTLPLPLLSYGGTGLVLHMVLIGFLLSVFRCGSMEGPAPYVSQESGRVQVADGVLSIRFKGFKGPLK